MLISTKKKSIQAVATLVVNMYRSASNMNYNTRRKYIGIQLLLKILTLVLIVLFAILK